MNPHIACLALALSACGGAPFTVEQSTAVDSNVLGAVPTDGAQTPTVDDAPTSDANDARGPTSDAQPPTAADAQQSDIGTTSDGAIGEASGDVDGRADVGLSGNGSSGGSSGGGSSGSSGGSSSGTLTCTNGGTNCSGACVNLTNDPSNCGACGNVCGGTACSFAQCSCGGGLVYCATRRTCTTAANCT